MELTSNELGWIMEALISHEDQFVFESFGLQEQEVGAVFVGNYKLLQKKVRDEYARKVQQEPCTGNVKPTTGYA